MFHADSMPDCQNEEDEKARAKKQPKDREHRTEAGEERADKSPKLEMRMDSEVASARAEVRPGIRTAHQDRRCINEEENADADAQEEKSEVRVLREESHFHVATLNN